MKLKSFFFTFLLTLLIAVIGFSQSPYRTIMSKGMVTQNEVTTSQVSLNNAWFGSSFSYDLAGDGNFEEDFLFTADILYNPKLNLDGVNFAIVGDAALLTGGDQTLDQLELGIFPWKIIHSNSENGFTVVAHGGVSYRVSPVEGTETSPQAVRLLAGAELAFPLSDNNLPATLSVTPVFETYNMDMGNTFGLESTFLMPIAPNLGIIGEVYIPFKDQFQSIFNAGVVVNGALGD